MPTTTPFHDEQNGAEIREKLNSMWADWLAALETAVGKDGWSPLLRTVADGARQVIQIYDWFGGTGTKPEQLGYMGATGIVSDIAQAVNFRGAAGTNGTNGWSPLLRTVVDGSRQVVQLYDWAGGTGDKPSFVGYFGESGLVSTAALAVDFRGAQGGTGSPGPANTLTIGTVTAGDAGEPAAASITGDAPNQTLNLTLPKGDVGATPNFRVASTTTGEPGTNALVVIGGTPTNPMLAFTIPRGAPGEGDLTGPGPVDDLQIVQFEGPTGKVVRAMDLTGMLAVEGGRPRVAQAGSDYLSSMQITAGDFNDITVPGNYHVNTNIIAATIANIPEPLAGALQVQIANAPGVIQTYTTYWNGNTRKIYQRTRLSAAGSWGAWSRVFTTIDPDTSKISKVNILGVGADLNAVLESGPYRVSQPINSPAGLDVAGEYGELIVTKGSNTIWQMLSGNNTGAIFSRVGVGTTDEGPYTFTAWGELLTDRNVKTINGQPIKGSGDLTVSSVLKFTYENRATLRTTTGEFAMVDLLGMFEHEVGSTLEDDDESCFATATGRWLLRCPSFDLIEAWNLPQSNMLPGRVINGWINVTITSVAANTAASVFVDMPGAEPGDTVIMTPPSSLGSTVAFSSVLSFYAHCTVAGRVTLVLCNPSGSAATLNPSVVRNWPVVVIKAK